MLKKNTMQVLLIKPMDADFLNRNVVFCLFGHEWLRAFSVADFYKHVNRVSGKYRENIDVWCYFCLLFLLRRKGEPLFDDDISR